MGSEDFPTFFAVVKGVLKGLADVRLVQKMQPSNLPVRQIIHLRLVAWLVNTLPLFSLPQQQLRPGRLPIYTSQQRNEIQRGNVLRVVTIDITA